MKEFLTALQTGLVLFAMAMCGAGCGTSWARDGAARSGHNDRG